MSNEHPRYSHPTITEAVCDIRFQLPEKKEWKPSLPGELFKYIQNDYPEMEPVAEMGFQFEFGPSGTGTKVLPQRQKARFRHHTRSLILQVAENSFSVSTLAPYQGWQTMLDDVLSAWQSVVHVIHPEVIWRMGLRYINRIEKENEQDNLETWFIANDYLPRGIINSKQGFLLREEIHLDTENILILTVGDSKPEEESVGNGTIIFDIDRITEQKIRISQDALEKELERLHTDVWEIFASSKGEKLENLLNGGYDE